MDNSVEALLSWQFILFSLGIFAIVWMFRTVFEYFIPKLVNAMWWQKLVLPIVPCLLGLVIAKFAKHYAYPDGLTTFSGRELFGLVAGMFSGLIYQVIKGMLKNKIQTYTNPNIYPYSPYTPSPYPYPPVPTTLPPTTLPPISAPIISLQTNAPSYVPTPSQMSIGGVGGKKP